MSAAGGMVRGVAPRVAPGACRHPLPPLPVREGRRRLIHRAAAARCCRAANRETAARRNATASTHRSGLRRAGIHVAGERSGWSGSAARGRRDSGPPVPGAIRDADTPAASRQRIGSVPIRRAARASSRRGLPRQHRPRAASRGTSWRPRYSTRSRHRIGRGYASTMGCGVSNAITATCPLSMAVVLPSG